MRKLIITPGEYYHIYNRGNNKQLIYNNKRDLARLLLLFIYLQSPVCLKNISRLTTNFSHFVQNLVLHKMNDEVKEEKKIIELRYIELISFVLMPNHFHLIVRELEKGGISKYIHRTLVAYTKYFNKKYESSGHLFQGTYQAVHIKDDEQLLYLSAYIHRNPREIKEWKNKEHNYPWSSYQDYIAKNRWGELLKNEIVIKQFTDTEEYKHFVEHSGAKDLSEEISID